MLCMRGADPSKFDKKGRGILQLAKNCQKGKQALYWWLRNKYPHLPMTYAEGRPKEKKQRGTFNQGYRQITNPYKRSWSSQEGQEWQECPRGE